MTSLCRRQVKIENAAATLHKGDPVIIVGREHTRSWGDEGERKYGRILDADNIGVDLNRATAEVRRISKREENQRGFSSDRRAASSRS